MTQSGRLCVALGILLCSLGLPVVATFPLLGEPTASELLCAALGVTMVLAGVALGRTA